MLTITSQKKFFVYTCTVDGESLVEGNEAIGSSSTAPNVLIDVESGDFAVDDAGGVVVWCVICEPLHPPVHRRLWTQWAHQWYSVCVCVCV
jgi:hypothetical protein